jgi:PAS domain S-box-containing protein
LDLTDRKQAEVSNARLAAIVSAADDAIMGLAPDGTVLAWNPAAERMFGYLAAEAIGQSARMLYPEAAAAAFESSFQRVQIGEHFQGEGAYVGKTGTELDVAFALSPVLGERGRVVGVSAVVRDISERKRTEQKLVETLALLLRTNNQRELALTAGRMGTFEVDLERELITWSDEIYQQVGVERTKPVMTVEDVEQFIHPDDREGVRARRDEAYRAGQTYENEFRVVRPDGEIRWLYVRAEALANGGKPARAYGVSMDITERKEREAHIRFLMREVSHRSKNLLAVVQAIASQTARATSSPLDFATDFGGRLKSLAASLDLLVREEWRGVSVKELVESQLGHYGEPEGRRVEMEGPQLLLSPLAAQYLGMALHELSTNAVKYGALSEPAGKVLIAWRIEGNRGKRRLHFSWLEKGGPPVTPPVEKGFGHMVIERMAAEALQGQVTLEFPREGLRWRLDADAGAAIKEG